MPLTLIEAAKLSANNGETKRAAVITMFARESSILAALPMQDIQGNAYGYNREGSLPGVAFRGINEAYLESAGVINPLVEALKIGGGDLDVDVAITKTQGEQVRGVHEQMKVKALAAEITRVIIKGDSTSNPREFDGLQTRITGTQLIPAGATAGGDALSLSVLDQAIDQTTNPTHIIATKAIRRLINTASRTTAVGGFIVMNKDDFGRPLYQYNGLPILVPYEDNGGTEPMGYNEANPGGGAAVGTSIYVVGFGPGLVAGIQNGIMEVRDLGELQTQPVKRTRVEWLIGMAVEHGRAATRIWGVKNAAVVA
ncbi:MAG TPA: hypothetical protein VNK51_05520 [Bradyrhizobium sp.]|nr:hypothetical protein [Bradyrhizobium sp.]